MRGKSCSPPPSVLTFGELLSSAFVSARCDLGAEVGAGAGCWWWAGGRGGGEDDIKMHGID